MPATVTRTVRLLVVGHRSYIGYGQDIGGPQGEGMRIALVTESFLPDVNGVANSVVRTAEHLVRRGHQPLVIAPQPPPAVRDTRVEVPYPVVRVASMPMPGYPQIRLGLPTPTIS